MLAPLAFVVVYEAGREAFRSSWLGAATLVATVGVAALSVGSGGAFRSLALPATAGGGCCSSPRCSRCSSPT